MWTMACWLIRNAVKFVDCCCCCWMVWNPIRLNDSWNVGISINGTMESIFLTKFQSMNLWQILWVIILDFRKCQSNFAKFWMSRSWLPTYHHQQPLFNRNVNAKWNFFWMFWCFLSGASAPFMRRFLSASIFSFRFIAVLSVIEQRHCHKQSKSKIIVIL